MASPNFKRGLLADMPTNKRPRTGASPYSDAESVMSSDSALSLRHGQVYDDEEEEDSDTSDEEYAIDAMDENDLVIMEPHSEQKIFETVHGSAEEIEDLESRLEQHTPDDWAKLAESLLMTNLDTNCSDRELLMTFKMLYNLFCFGYKDNADVLARGTAIYPNFHAMQERRQKITNVFGFMHIELVKRQLINEDRSGRELKGMLNQLSYQMKQTFDTMVAMQLVQKGTDKSIRARLAELTPMSIFREVDLSKLKKHQQLLFFYQQTAHRNNFKKDGECLYKPKYNEAGEFVFAYEYVYDISDFVFQSLYPVEQNHYWYECLTERGNTPKQCIDLLTNVKSEWLPTLKRNPNIHSFRNGLFVLSTNQFYYFKQTPGKNHVSQIVGGNVTAIKFHDIVFHEQQMTEEVCRYKVKTYMNIEMAPIYAIFTFQKFEMSEIRWIFCLLGRLLHPLGKHDTWAVFPYFLGLAGTGKSTSLRLVASLLEARDLGYLNNTLQKTFALEGIFNKLLYLALDIDEHFQLDQATFQSMVCGEEVSVLRKFKRPITMLWKSHGGFAGNKLPTWTDNGGSLSRRLIVIEFLQPVLKCDPGLFEKCLNIKDRFLKVINSAYLDLSEKYHNCGIKEVIPAKFKQSEQKALLELNILMAFIKDCAEVDPKEEGEKDYTAPFNNVVKAFKGYCKANSVKPKQFKYNFYNGVFAKFQIKVVTPESADSDPHGMLTKYILGLKLKDSAMENLD